jgi:hypothetical protein
MQYQIQSIVERHGIQKRVAWRAFATLLTANEKNIKVVQELL